MSASLVGFQRLGGEEEEEDDRRQDVDEAARVDDSLREVVHVAEQVQVRQRLALTAGSVAKLSKTPTNTIEMMNTNPMIAATIWFFVIAEANVPRR